MTANLPPVLDAAGWAEILQCSQKTVEERMRCGDLPGEKFGEGWICPSEAMLHRINEIAIKKMMDRRTAQAPAAVAANDSGKVKPMRKLPTLPR